MKFALFSLFLAGAVSAQTIQQFWYTDSNCDGTPTFISDSPLNGPDTCISPFTEPDPPKDKYYAVKFVGFDYHYYVSIHSDTECGTNENVIEFAAGDACLATSKVPNPHSSGLPIRSAKWSPNPNNPPA